MNSSKIKSFLTILLAAVNIFLLINILLAKSANSYLSDEMLEESAKALEKREIYVEKQQIPAQRYTQSVILLDCSTEIRLKAAESFLGDVVAEYSLPDGMTYQSNNAYLSFFDNGRAEYGLLENRDSASPASPTPPNELSVADRSASKNVKAAFKRLTANVGTDKISYRIKGQLSQDGAKVVYIQLLFNGLPLYDGIAVMVFDNEILTYLSGKYIFDAIESAYSQSYIDAPNALFLLDEKDIIINDIQMIYYPVRSDENQYFLIPSWQIAYDDDKQKVFDGVSGYERQ